MKRDLAFKRRVVEALRDQLAADLQALERSQEDSQAGATHAESRPEHAKDTRSVEASSLARGLAERVVTLRNALERLRSFEPRAFAPDARAGLSALVCLDFSDPDAETPSEDDRALYFLAPAGAGVKLVLDGVPIDVIGPTSPLGSALMRCEEGDDVQYRTPGGRREAVVVWIA